MDKALRILGISFNAVGKGSYILILGEYDGTRKVPIIMKQSDAEYVALKMEGIKSTRPFTQDLIRILTDRLGVDLYEVRITNILEGIFYCKLVFHNMEEEIELDCSIGDAICLSMSYRCNIICTEEVMQIVGVEMDEDGNLVEERPKYTEKSMSVGISTRQTQKTNSVENLTKMLDRAIENEEYEIAAQLRDRINELSVLQKNQEN